MLLVMGQLFGWAVSENKSLDSATAFSEAVELLATTNRLSDAFHLVMAYLLVSEDRRETLPVNWEHVVGSLAAVATRNAGVLSQDTEQRNLIVNVAARLPNLADMLGLQTMSTSPDATSV